MLADLKQRSVVPEVMDQPDLDAHRHHGALRGLGRLNWWSGSAANLWSVIRRMANPQGRPLRILDVACGGGDVLVGIGLRARRAGMKVELAGCDISPPALAFAGKRAKDRAVSVEFIPCDVLRDNLPEAFDCILSTLFLHHLATPQAVELLQKMKAATRDFLIINDLLRSRGGLALTHVAARLLTRSDVVHVDGPRSVRAAFTIPEIEQVASEAGCGDADTSKCWPCRFLLTWRKPR